MQLNAEIAEDAEKLMKIILIGASGTIGKRIYDAFSKKHEVVRASRSGADGEVDITDAASIEQMYQTVNGIDAVICAAGPAKFGALSELSEEDFYKQGKLDGEIKTYFFNGSPKTDEHYKDDLKNGEMRAYTFDGFLNYVINYKDNEPEGEAKFYYKNGKTEAIKNFTGGKLNGPYKHYSEPGVPGTDKGVLELEGIRNTRIFIPSSNRWVQSAIGCQHCGRVQPHWAAP